MTRAAGRWTLTARAKVFIAVAVVVVVADQVTKWMAVSSLTTSFSSVSGEPLGFGEKLDRFLWDKHPARSEVVAVVDNFWHYRYVENPGAAWGFLSDSDSALRTPFFLVVAVLAMGFIIMYFRRTEPDQGLLRFGLALVLGGAVGNFIDRVRLGYVIDFIDWHWYDKFTWPTFNVADAAISVGVGILLLDMILDGLAARREAEGGARG